MKKSIITIAVALVGAATAFAQTADDACLFSQAFYQGTAKALGMGNAMGAVGGDMTAVNINPAGMGIYRSNEFTASLNLLDNHHVSCYYGSDVSANKWRLSIPNVGYVGTKQKSNFRTLRFTQWGIGLTRINDYNMHTFARGVNPTSSRIDNYLARIDGYADDELQAYFPYDIYPAWQTYLIDLYEDEQGLYYSSPVPQGNIWQSQDDDFKGRSEEWTFAGSANFAERLFLGLSVNLTHIKREGTRVFEESRTEATETDFNRWSFSEDIASSGMGVNAKVGFIWHANRWLRLGGAFHTPTAYAFDESWQTETESEISYIQRKYISEKSSYEYTFVKPLKWVGSAAFVVGQRGMISLDAEYTNFGKARFSADDYNYDDVNADIKAVYGKTFNLRIGSEWRIADSYLRVGAGYYGSPFGFGKDGGSVKKASVGLSLPASSSTTFDFAYELSHGLSYLTLYDAGALDIESVSQRQFRHILLATLKVRF